MYRCTSQQSLCPIIAAIFISLLSCKKPVESESEVKSLEAIAGLATKITCKIDKNSGATPPKRFIDKAKKLDPSQLSAWSAIVSALPSRIRTATRNGAMQLSQTNKCESSSSKSSALDVDPGCLQFQVTRDGTPSVVQVAGLSSADEILTHGVRLLTLAYLNLEHRLYLAGIGNRTLQEGLINESAQIAIAFIKDLELLQKKGLVTKERLKLIGHEVRSSPQLFSAVILAHAVESLSCGELSSVKSRFPEVVARYQGSKKSISVSQLLGQEIKSGLSLERVRAESVVEESVQNADKGTYKPQSPTEAKESLSTLDPKAKGDLFGGSAASSFSFDEGREGTSIPNMSLRIGNAVVQDPRSGIATDRDAVLSEAKRLNFPYPAVKTLEGFMDDANRAKGIHEQYKSRTAPESEYYKRLERIGMNSTKTRDIDRKFDYILNAGAYERGFIPLVEWMDGRKMIGTGEDGKMRKYQGNNEVPW